MEKLSQLINKIQAFHIIEAFKKNQAHLMTFGERLIFIKDLIEKYDENLFKQLDEGTFKNITKVAGQNLESLDDETLKNIIENEYQKRYNK